MDFYPCTHCPFESRYIEPLVGHIKAVHRRGKPSVEDVRCLAMREKEAKGFRCPDCEFSTLKGESFKAHMLGHVVPKEVYLCSSCEFRSDNGELVRAHQKIGHEKRKKGSNAIVRLWRWWCTRSATMRKKKPSDGVAI